MNSNYLKILLLLSVFTYTVALFSPVYIIDKSTDSFIGIVCLLLGWLSYFDLNAFIAWFANLFYFVAFLFVLLKKFTKTRIVFLFISVVIGINALYVNELMTDEGGSMKEVEISFGFYLWELSFVWLLLHELYLIKYKSYSARSF